MSTRCICAALVCVAVVLIVCAPATAEDETAIPLPEPQKNIGKPLMEALELRHSSRAFSDKELPPQTLSNLLWAAFGVNRSDGKRTAPSAMNLQEIDIYVCTADGVFLYDAQANALAWTSTEDLRALTGGQPFVASAPVNLVYVADLAKMGKMKEDQKAFYSAADTGFIAQNVYLYCASEGLVNVVRGWVDRPKLAQAMGLRSDQHVILAHTIGYPVQSE